MLLPIWASAYTAKIDNIYYDFNTEAKTATVTWRGLNESNNDAYTGTLNIPSTVIYEGKEYTVTKIDRKAFKHCPNLLSISIPNSITYISGNTFDDTGWYNSQPNGIVYLDNWVIDYKGEEPIGSLTIADGTIGIAEYAFYCRGYLTNITIPNTVRYIGIRAFEGCSSITSVNIPDGVTRIEAGTFHGCTGLTSVTIPNSVKTIEDSELGYGAFKRCSGLTSVTFGNSLIKIGSEAFANCTGLTSVTIPNNVTSIGSYIFAGCSYLSSVTLSNNISIIPWDAFSGCVALKSLSVPSSVTAIEGAAFRNCTSLESVSIPNSVTSIGDESFCDCSGLTSISIPNTVTNIGQGAFYRCYNLSSANIPNSIKSLGNYTFSYCVSLNSIVFPDNMTIIPEGICEGCSSLKELKLPNDIKIIKTKAFNGCSSLEYITFPSSVEFIYQECFSGCFSLKKIVTNSITPPFIYDNSFSNYLVPLKVPKGCKEAYQSAQGWKNFTNISDADKYKLTYIVDNEEYKSYEIEEGKSITPEDAPVKEGYTFSGWSEIPQTMPAHDVTVTGAFSINSYKLTYMIDDKVYKETMYEYGATITPEPQPEGDYQTFEWADIPQTMPAYDVVVHASYTSGIMEVLLSKQHNVHIYSPNAQKLNKLKKGINIVVFNDGTTKKIIKK